MFRQTGLKNSPFLSEYLLIIRGNEGYCIKVAFYRCCNATADISTLWVNFIHLPNNIFINHLRVI